jgi:peptidoglycan/xylan/chitin deacetylase (PgdA/CDA1 family)
MMTEDLRPGYYEPPRGFGAKITRRAVQWRAAAPIWFWPDEPCLSITFDDFPRSAAENGLPVLGDHDVRATFYACAGLMGQESPFGPMWTADDLRSVIGAGHEIGCHTRSHLDCARAPIPDVEGECAANAEGLAALGLNGAPLHFAYPYGETTHALKQSFKTRFATGRGIMPGLNIARVDRMQLRAVSLYGERAEAGVVPWLSRAKALKAWLIVLTHDVADRPSRFGCTPQALNTLIAEAKAQGFRIAPVGEAFAQLSARTGP